LAAAVAVLIITLVLLEVLLLLRELLQLTAEVGVVALMQEGLVVLEVLAGVVRARPTDPAAAAVVQLLVKETTAAVLVVAVRM
jgi:hypothetical protein